MKGVDRIFHIARAFLPNEAEVGIRIVEAAKDAGVKHFVFSSVIPPVLAEFANRAAKPSSWREKYALTARGHRNRSSENA